MTTTTVSGRSPPRPSTVRDPRRYRGDTLVLETEFETDHRRGPAHRLHAHPREHPQVVRVVEGVSGTSTCACDLPMRFGYGSVVPWVRRSGSLSRPWPAPTPCRCGPGPHPRRGHDDGGRLHRERGRPGALRAHLVPLPRGRAPRPVDPRFAIEDTQMWWEDWVGALHLRGPWRDAVMRSLITLKALTYNPTGGIVAAPTTSLPETLGGVPQLGLPLLLVARRHLDPRIAHAGRLLRRGHGLAQLAAAGRGRRPGRPADHVRPGRRAAARRVGGALASRATRIGPRPDRQRRRRPVPARRLRRGDVGAVRGQQGRRGPERDGLGPAALLMDFVEDDVGRTRRRDLGGARARAGTSPTPRSWPGWPSTGPSRWWTSAANGPVDEWRALPDTIHEQVCTKGFNAKVGAFTQYYGSDALDASLLMIPLVGFLPATDPRVRSHHRGHRAGPDRGRLRAALPGHRRPCRRRPRGHEGAFLACSFWLADCLI